MGKTETVSDYLRNAVESFVQTVVFVDDRIYTPPPDGRALQSKVAKAPGRRRFATKSAELHSEKVNTSQVVEAEEAQFSPHDIQSSFSKKHIVCSLHQPRKDSAVGPASDTYKLCAAADIVIADWDLGGDSGKKAKDLVCNLVVQSLEEDPHQLRLVLVYTSEPDLKGVSVQIYDKLEEQIPEALDPRPEDNGLSIHTSNARIVVLGKPANRIEEYKPFEVEEKHLAERAVYEFTILTSGLLQGFILMGLAAVRRQSRKILTKFSAKLDAAFLTHRALGLPHEEALDHLAPLLVSEIEAVLEDSASSFPISKDVIEDWCNSIWQPAPHSALFVGNSAKTHDFACKFTSLGPQIYKKYDADKRSEMGKLVKALGKNPERWPSNQLDLISAYLSSDSHGHDQRELSILMSQRTQYKPQRILTLGSIIKEDKSNGRYLLCLQPVCDSVRLESRSAFLFCVLDAAESSRATHVLRTETGSYIDLSYKPAVEKSATIKFSPVRGRSNPLRGLVVAKDLVFSSGRVKYIWIAQLKPQHAQRAAEQFARLISRVGLTESEWQRLKAK